MRAVSISDWVFYPLAVLVSAAMIYGSLQIRPPGGEPAFEENLLLVEGPALANFFNGPGTRATFMPDFPGGPVARLSADGSLDAMGNQSAGTGLYLPADYARAASGHTIRISMLVRASDDDHDNFRAGYFLLGGTASGWQTLEASDRFEEHSFDYTPPEDGARNQHVIGIWPDPEGRGRSVLVRRLSIEILP